MTRRLRVFQENKPIFYQLDHKMAKRYDWHPTSSCLHTSMRTSNILCHKTHKVFLKLCCDPVHGVASRKFTSNFGLFKTVLGFWNIDSRGHVLYTVSCHMTPASANEKLHVMSSVISCSMYVLLSLAETMQLHDLWAAFGLNSPAIGQFVQQLVRA